jgi:hypothetical protein
MARVVRMFGGGKCGKSKSAVFVLALRYGFGFRRWHDSGTALS